MFALRKIQGFTLFEGKQLSRYGPHVCYYRANLIINDDTAVPRQRTAEAAPAHLM